MTARFTALCSRLRPAYCAAVMWTAFVAGALAVLAPAALLGSVWPPLHARCIGVMALSMAVAMATARRALDPAALRVPLLALSWWSLPTAALAWTGDGMSLPWLWFFAAVGGAALALAHIDGDPPAPAQHADRAWRGFALLAMLVAVPLLLSPPSVVALWPWRLGAPLVAQYAPIFLAWGAAAWLIARERRRYVRAPVLSGLLVWSLGVLLVSLWHVAAFRLASAPAWLWFAAFAVLALLVTHRLWPTWPQRVRKALGPRSHDCGTDRE